MRLRVHSAEAREGACQGSQLLLQRVAPCWGLDEWMLSYSLPHTHTQYHTLSGPAEPLSFDLVQLGLDLESPLLVIFGL